MESYKRFVGVGVLIIFGLLAGCGGGGGVPSNKPNEGSSTSDGGGGSTDGGGDSTGSADPVEDSHWDQMEWDKGKWG